MLDRLRLLAKMIPAAPKLLGIRPDSRTTAAERFERLAEEAPERLFVLFEGRRVSLGETNASANRVARWAHGLGLGKDDAVALLMENRPEYVSTWLGVAKTGATTACLNTNLGGRGLLHALESADARHVVVGRECLDQLAGVELPAALRVWVADDPGASERNAAPPAGARSLDDALAGLDTSNPDPEWREDLRAGDDLFYIYTSGTTGLPKAARFSHLRFLSSGATTAWALDLAPDDVYYCPLPLYHTAGGVLAVSGALHGGCPLALRRRFSASGFVPDVRETGATVFHYIGELCRYLVNLPPGPHDRDNRLRVAFGNGLRPDIWEAFQERFGIPRIVEFYGATEGNAGMANLENKVGSVGRFPFDFLHNGRLVRYDVTTETHPRDERGFCIPCGVDEPGEFIGRLPARANDPRGRYEGYTSKRDSERKILRDVFKPGDAWFRSGDLLRQDADGFYYFVDRIGDTFRWKGENVSTQEVAEAVSGLPGVEMVAVYGVQVPGADGRAGMAALLLSPEARFDGEALYRLTEERLPRYAAPVFVRLIRDMDLTGTFKLRKVTLQAEGFDLERVTDPIHVRDDDAGSYVPLTPAIAAAIADGTRRL